MPRRFIKQTAAVIATETALTVYVLLAILVAMDYRRKIEEAKSPTPQEETHCYVQSNGSSVCEYPQPERFQ